MQAAPKPVKIGVMLDLADDAGVSPMAPASRSIEMRFEEAFANGEIDRPVTLVRRGFTGLPAGDAEGTVRTFEELAAEHVLAMIGPGVTDNCLITTPLADRHGIPSLNFPGTEHSRGQFGFQFQLGSLPDEGPMIVDELVNRGHKEVAVIRDHGPIGGEYFDYFNQATIRRGLTIAADVRVQPVASDLRGAVGQAKASGAGCLVYLGLGLVVVPLSAALAEAGWSPPRFMNTAFLHGYMNPEALKALEGWVGVDMVDLENPVTSAFLDRFEKRYGAREVTPLHTVFYDMATMVVEGIRWAPLLTPDGIRQGMERAHQIPSTCGGKGTVMGFGPWDRAAYKGPDWLLFQTVKDGKYQPFAKA